mgnify:CR=1 FL=1
MSPDRPGVILAGGIRSHQENYASAFASAGCRLLAVGVAPGLGESETGRHAELAASLGLPLLPLDQAVALPEATIASISVDMMHRARVATLCAQAGLHLYLDKPLAGSPADATAIAAAVHAAGVGAQVFSHVTTPWAQAAHAAIREGRLGRILAIHADMLMAKGIPSALPSKPRKEQAIADFRQDIAKRELTDMGIYPVSLAAWLLGRPATSVTAVTANHFFAEHLSHDVEDYGAMLVDFEDGATASITCGRVGWQSWRRPFLSRVIIVGERDTLVFDSEPAELIATSGRGVPAPARNALDPMEMWLSTRSGPRPQPAISGIALVDEGSRDVAAFIAALASGVPSGIGIDAAAHHCAIIAAAYRSAAEERAVAVA